MYDIDIRRIREELLLTQEELAKEMGVSYATIQGWEQKKRTPSIKYKRKIIEFCKQKNINIEEQ